MLNYCNKVILAPMVRQNTLPMRLLALRYGADLIYGPELIDVTMLMCKRKVNDILGAIDYVDEIEGNVKFRTCDAEKSQLVFQMGSSCPERAVALAKLVQNDVSGIDLNMGCPAKTTTNFGMGAALLKKKDIAKSILKNLVENMPLPITCKIRKTNEFDESINLAKELEETGISAIAVHGRTPYARHDSPVDIEVIREIASNLTIPVIANGGSNEIYCYDDIEKFREACNTTSVMIGGAAQRNVSIFREGGLIPHEEVAKEYLKLAVDYDETVVNVKYFLAKLYALNGKKIRKLETFRNFDKMDTLEKFCEMLGLQEYCREKQNEYASKGYKRMPCASFHNLDISTPGIYEHHMRIYKSLRNET